jgi:hypothetical protein
VRLDSDASAPAPGQWRGVIIQATALPQTRFAHAVIEDAGGGPNGAAISVRAQFELDVQHVTIRHSAQHGVYIANEARFSGDSTALTVTESGREDPYSAPVWFYSASQVGTLPDGEYSGNASDEIYVDRDHVRTTATWRNPGVRYRLARGLRVGSDNGAVLTVAPGTTLAFNSETVFSVGYYGDDGAAVLDGESEQTPITLTSARPHPSAGDWGGLRLGEHRADAAMRIAHVVVEHAGHDPGGIFSVAERFSCRPSSKAAISIRDHDIGSKITRVTVRSLPADATAILVGFRGDVTDYTARDHRNDFSEAGTTCRQNVAPEGECPDPACR